jgi:nitrite reductase/ring-hydroxylating ferredoxin subunit
LHTYNGQGYFFVFFLCHYQDLVNNPVQILSLPSSENNRDSVILTLHGDSIRAFRNQCPHAWVPLDLASPDILSGCKQYLQCSSHFAQFRKQDGYCIYGPCQGQSLQKVDVVVDKDKIFLRQDPLS